MHTDRRGTQKCRAKGRGKEAKIQDFMYRDTMNVEPEILDYTSNNWSHRNINKRVQRNIWKPYQETFSRSTTQDS